MTPDRKRELLEAYGVDPARWPEDEAGRSDGAIAAGASDEAGALDLGHARAEAGRLDALLNLYDVAPAPGALRNALLGIPEQAVDIRDAARTSRPVRTSRPAWSLFGALRGAFPQLAGLAIASVLGFMVGVADLLPNSHDQSVSVDASGLVLGEDGLGSFDS